MVCCAGLGVRARFSCASLAGDAGFVDHRQGSRRESYGDGMAPPFVVKALMVPSPLMFGGGVDGGD